MCVVCCALRALRRVATLRVARCALRVACCVLCGVSRRVAPRRAAPRRVVLRCVVSWRVALRCVVLCCDALRCVVL